MTSVESNPDGKNEFLLERGVSAQASFPHLGVLSQQQSIAHLINQAKHE